MSTTSNKRTIDLKSLLHMLKALGISENSYDNYMVDIDDTSFMDSMLGRFTRLSEENAQRPNLLVAKTRNVKKVLGGISDSPISNARIDGIVTNRNGSCTIDMSADWIKKFNVTREDFLEGNEKFLKSKQAAERVNAKNSGGASITEKKEFFDHRFKVGTIWLFSVDAIAAFNQYGTSKVPNLQHTFAVVQ